MGRTMLDWLVSAVRRGLKADFTRQALWAATCGAAALIVCQQALWTVGGAASAHSATYLAILVGILGGMTVPVRGNRLVQLGVALVVFLVGAAWLPWLWDAALSLPGLSSIESSLWNSVATFLVAIPLVALPTALAVALLRSISRGEGTLAGVALGIAASLVAASWIGVELLGLLVAVGLLAVVLRNWSVEPASLSVPAGEAETIALPVPHATAPQEVAPQAPAFAGVPFLAALVGVAACGGLTVLIERVTHQWSIASVPSLWADAAVLVTGVALGSAWAARLESRRRPLPVVLAFLLAGCGALAGLSGSPEGVQASLWLNAHVEQPALLIVLRALLAGVGLIPVGLAFGLVQKSVTRDSHGIVMTGLAVAIGASVAEAGFASLRSFGSPMALTALFLAWTGVVAAVVIATQTSGAESIREHLTRQWSSGWSRVFVAGLATLLIVASLWTSNYDPAVAARTLFTTRGFMAYRNGLSSRLLPHLDEGRLVRMVEGDQGTLTVWKHGGHQLHIRENGVPRGILSLDPSVHPQFSAEVLQSVFPLVLHERPDRVLVMGVGSGVNFVTALDFPIQQCVCAEGNAGLMRIVTDLHRDQALIDDRMHVWPVDPHAALRATSEKFDVIVSNPGHPALASSQATFTPEFYNRAASRLEADGIFCQWLQCIDLGPEPLRTLVKSVQSAFPEVMAVEIAHREFLILGTRSKKGLVRPDLYERCQTAQVRRTMAGLGLDWTILVDLPAYRTEDLVAFANEREGLLAWLPSQPTQLPFAMPIELMSWTPKQELLQAALARRTGRIVNWLGDAAEDARLLRRLGEVAGQQKLKTQLAEQYWAYRKSVREQVSTNPATRIRQVSGGEGLDDEDRRRIDYFKVLSRAVKSHDPADVDRLLQFAEPYDPLLSDFIHFEAAELYSRAQPRDFERELRHRLHSVFYASPIDTSVQSVVGALNLLRDHPEAAPDPTVRWDLCNALLQSLQVRWEARIGMAPRQTTRALMRDIDQTLSAAEVTMGAMTELTKQAGLSAELWNARRQVLQKHLLNPLENYRAVVLKRQKDIKVAGK